MPERVTVRLRRVTSGGSDGYGASGAVALRFWRSGRRDLQSDGFVDKQLEFCSAGGEFEAHIACLRARNNFGQVVRSGKRRWWLQGRLNYAAEHKRQDSASPCFELGYVLEFLDSCGVRRHGDALPVRAVFCFVAEQSVASNGSAYIKVV